MLKAKVLPALVSALILVSGAAAAKAAGDGYAYALTDGLSVTTVTEGFEITDGTLTAFNVPEGVTGYFQAKLPDTVTAIATGAFDASDNSQLSDYFLGVEIPSSVTAIAESAFIDCKSLVEVCYPNTVGVADSGLYDNAISRVTQAAEKSLHAATADGGESYLFVRSGAPESTEWVLLDYDGTAENLTLPEPSFCDAACTSYSIYNDAFAGSDIASLVVPAGVTAIGERAFSGSKITSLTLNEGLITIGAQAFDNIGITSLVIPASLETVSNHAFENCTSLSDVKFANRTKNLLIDRSAFEDCTGLKVIKLPDNTTVRNDAFKGCTSLAWAYVGNGSRFINTAAGQVEDVVFFPQNTNITIVFPSASEYNALMSRADSETFKNNNGSAATYMVDVNCYIGDSEEAVVYTRLHGENFNYVYDESTGYWNTDTAFSLLPVQAANYASTVWYGERTLQNKVSWEKVNQLLATDDSIDLYCYQTVTAPALPAEPATWVYDEKISYDVNDLSSVLKALGSEQKYTEKQLSALDFEVTYADSNSNKAELPSKISRNGVYSVSINLNSDYGAWVTPTASTITVNVNTNPFSVVLIILSVVGALAVLVTVSTAVIRKKVLAKNKKKQISSHEARERYRRIVGDSNAE